MTETVTLYIGADNGFLDMDRIGTIVAKNHEGFTIWQAEGHWKGETEPSAVVLINDDSDLIARTVHTLKSELHQDAIGVQFMPGIEYA